MHYMSAGNDRRRFQRLKLNLDLVYKVETPIILRIRLGDKEIEATTLDISEGGMAFLTDYDIPVLSGLALKFTLFKLARSGEINFYRPMQIEGEVRSNNLSENKEYRLGICFVKKDAAVKDEISNFVKSAN
jgi:c-di-GMP-binding flagellar brake protein YcgR